YAPPPNNPPSPRLPPGCRAAPPDRGAPRPRRPQKREGKTPPPVHFARLATERAQSERGTQGRELRSGADTECPVDTRQGCLNGLRADEERLCDLAIRASARCQACDLRVRRSQLAVDRSPCRRSFEFLREPNRPQSRTISSNAVNAAPSARKARNENRAPESAPAPRGSYRLPLRSAAADNRTAVHLRCRHERDLPGGGGREDVVVGEELLRRDRLEDDLHFLPKRVEAVALDRVEDAGEHEPGRLRLVGHVDRVDRAVACKQRSLAAA